MGLKYLHGSAVGRILSSLILSVDLLTKSSNVRIIWGIFTSWNDAPTTNLQAKPCPSYTMVPTHQTDQELVN